MSKVTTAEQYEKLCDMMATKRDIAQGFQKRPKEEVQEFWEEAARNLNALGPPTKDSNTWRKVWIDWKCYMKRKLSHNKKERMSTGGGPCRLQRISPLEEKVIALTGLETCTSGISGARDYGDRVEVKDAAETTKMDISARSDDIPSTSRASSQNREARADKESTSSLLKQQIQNQKNFIYIFILLLKKKIQFGTHLKRLAHISQSSPFNSGHGIIGCIALLLK